MPDLHQAAVLLASLPEAEAAQLVIQLPPAERERVLEEIERLDSISPEDEQAALSGFADELTSLPPRFEVMQSLAPMAVSRLLRDEQPQTIAAIVAELPARLGYAVVAEMPAELQAEVIRRLAHQPTLDVDVLADLERVISQRLKQPLRVPTRNEQGGGANDDRSLDLARLAAMARENPDLVRKSAA